MAAEPIVVLGNRGGRTYRRTDLTPGTVADDSRHLQHLRIFGKDNIYLGPGADLDSLGLIAET